MEREWGLGARARILLDDYALVVVSVFLIVAAVGGVLIYTTHVEPGTVTDERTAQTWETSAGYDHAATVTSENPVFPVGATLENRPLYYTTVTPELDSTFRYGLEAPAGELAVTVDSTLVIRSVDGEDGTEFWRVDRQLESRTATATPGRDATVPLALNISAVRSEVDAIEEDLGSPGTTQVFVRTRMTAEGTVAGGSFSESGTYDMSVEPGGTTYSVAADGETTPHERTERVVREPDYDPVRLAAGPVLLAFGLLGVFAVAIGRYRGTLVVTDDERATLATAREHSEFDEWISAGEIPDAVRSRQAVRVTSLADLVDTAIDTDRRVIHDDADDTYHVVDGAVRYEYRPEDGPLAATDEVATGDTGGGDDDGVTDEAGTGSDDEGDDLPNGEADDADDPLDGETGDSRVSETTGDPDDPDGSDDG
jgi:hypothetical protein